GRVSLAIAREGIEIVGIDQSERMLKHAKEKSDEMGLTDWVQWIQADMAQFDLGKKFPLIIIPYRSFLHITSVKEQISTLTHVWGHLTNEGCFAFNVFVPHFADLMAMEGTQHFRGVFPIPGTED